MARELEYGDKGDDVRELQEALASLGYQEVGTPDGEFFQKTQAAVHRFQADHGLDATGRADEATLGAIEQAKIEAMNRAREHSGDSPWDDPNAPHHQRDTPAEGYVRVHYDAETFYDMEQSEADAIYVDNSLVNFAIQPIPVTLEVLSQPLDLYYANGAQYRLPTLDAIDDGYDDGTYLMYIGGGLLGRCTGGFQPMFNAFTTPRLHWLKWAILDEMKARAQQQLEMAELVSIFATIVSQYGQLDGTASWTKLSSGQFPT